MTERTAGAPPGAPAAAGARSTGATEDGYAAAGGHARIRPRSGGRTAAEDLAGAERRAAHVGGRGAGGRFDVVLRGYDPRAVDELVRECIIELQAKAPIAERPGRPQAQP